MRAIHVLVTTLIVLASIEARAQVRPTVQGPAGTVTLPVAHYDDLLDRAARQPRPADRPPVGAVAGRAELRARVDSGLARGTLRLEGEVFERGPVKVPLVRNTMLLDARMDGRPLPVLHEDHTHAAVVTGPAPFTVALDWAVPLGSAPGRAWFILPEAVAGSASAVIDLPGDPADVRAQHAIVTRRQSAAGRTTIELALEPGAISQLSWSVRDTGTPAAPAEARVLADVKSLVTIGEADLRIVSIVETTVLRGEPRSFEVQLPSGYELAAVTGTSLESSSTRDGTLTLSVRDPSLRRHQFLLSLEQPHAPGSFKVDTAFPTVLGAQREVGEGAIEGIGTIEVAASGEELRRMDVREINAALRSLARQPLVAAFRYQRRPTEPRVLTLDVKRFADAPVMKAVAEKATVTTLVTSEGRMLTEVALRIRNRAQPFMKVTLPAGATMLSVDVASEAARPVVGADGTRIPLLRAGFTPDGPYSVSFVYLHAGQAFARRGDAQMVLPAFDVPVSMLEWELFLPEQYAAKPTGGNVIPAHLFAGSESGIIEGYGSGLGAGVAGGVGGGSYRPGGARLTSPLPGQVLGRVTDATGALLAGATITVAKDGAAPLTAIADADGFYVINGVASGTVTVSSELQGFTTVRRTFTFDQQPRRVDFEMPVGTLSEAVTVEAETPPVETHSVAARITNERDSRSRDIAQQAPSQNVINLQRRVAGVLPVRIDVPRMGTSHRFVKPLVWEEATTVSFRYKTVR